eukprot:3401035-Rhodomonas_salina.1
MESIAAHDQTSVSGRRGGRLHLQAHSSPHLDPRSPHLHPALIGVVCAQSTAPSPSATHHLPACRAIRLSLPGS